MNEELTFILRFKNEAAAAIKGVGDQFKRVGTSIKGFQATLTAVGVRLDALGTKLLAVGAKAKIFGSRLRELGSLASIGLTAPIAGAGFAILKTAGSFEQALNQVQSVSQATEDQFKQLRATAKTLGATTAFSATQAAEGFIFLSRAGLDVDTQLKAIGPALNLAGANALSLAESSNIVTNVLAGFRLEVDKLGNATDVLTRAAQISNTDVRQLGDAFSYVGPTASSLNQDFNQTAALLGALGNAGIQAGRAGTSLSRVLLSLVKPSAEAQKRLDELGISALDSKGKVRPLVDILADFEKVSLRASDAQTIFGFRGGPAFSALLGQGTDAIKKLEAELNKAGGTAKNTADVQLRGLFGAFRELRSATEDLFISISDSGFGKFVEDIVRNLTEFIRNIDLSNDSLTIFYLKIAAVVGVIGPLLSLLGFLSIGFGGLTSAIGGTIKALGVAAKFLGTVDLAVLASPIGIVIAALGALTAAFFYFKDTLVTFNDGATFTVFEVAVATIQELIAIALEAANTVKAALAPAFNYLGDILENVFGFAIETAQDFFLAVLPLATAPLNNIIKAIQLFGVAGKTAFTVVGLLVRNLREIFAGDFEAIGAILNFTANAITDAFTGVANYLGGVFDSLSKTVGGFFDSVGLSVKLLAQDVGVEVADIREKFSSLNDGPSIGDKLFKGIPEAVQNGLGEAKTIIQSDPLGDAFDALSERVGKRLRASVKEPVKEGLTEAKKVIEAAPGMAVITASKTLGERIGEALKKGFDDFVKGFKSASDDFVRTSRDTTAQAGELFKSFAENSQEAIKGFITSGKFDLKSLGSAVIDTIQTILAQRITGGIAAALFGEPGGVDKSGGTSGATGGLFGLLGGGLSSLFGGAAKAPAAGGGAADATGEAAAAVSGPITAALDNQTESLNAATEAATATTGGFFSTLGGTFSAGLSSLGSSLGNLFSGAADAAGGLIQSIVGSVGSAIGGAVGGGGTTASAAAMGGIAGMNGPMGIQDFAFMSKAQSRRAKRFATGGLTDSIPAMLSPGEAVVPLPNGRAIPVDMNGQQGNTTNISFNLPPNADVDSFIENQAQIEARLARTIARANARET